MQKVRIFYPDKNNKLSFSKDELEKLINEVYQEGYNDAKNEWCTITYPSTTPYSSLSPYYTATTATTVDCKDCITSDKADKVTISNNAAIGTYTADGSLANGTGSYKVSATCPNSKTEVENIITDLKNIFGE